MKLLLENWREFVKQEVEELLPHGEVRAVKKIGSSTLSPEEQAEQDLEKYGYVRDEDERDFDIEVQIAGVSNEDVEEWAFSEEAEELESSYNYDVQLRIVENWRGYLKEQEEPCAEATEFVWHGSKTGGIKMFEPRQAHDAGGGEGQSEKAVYAAYDPNFAIAMGLTEPDENGDEDKFIDHEKKPLQLVLIKGKIRENQKIYLYKLPKQLFEQVPGNENEALSKVGMRPCEVKELNVGDYLNLVRIGTEEDQAYWNKHTGGSE